MFEDVEKLGRELGVSFKDFTPDTLRRGMIVELEHGKAAGPYNVSDDNPRTTAMIALAHLAERADYYDRLPAVEGEMFIFTWLQLLVFVAIIIVITLLIIHYAEVSKFLRINI